jgi:hypothetical protein
MAYNMIIGYDIYDRFTMEHFLLCQSMILTTSFFAHDSTINYIMQKWRQKQIDRHVKC